MIIFAWLLILAVCLFSASVIWEGIRDPLFYWLQGRSYFFDSLDLYSNLCYYNNKSPEASFSWSLDLPWYYLDLEYTPTVELHWPYYVAYKTVEIWCWNIGWFTLDITKIRK